MPRRLLLVILGFGVFAGFGSGFAHLRHMRQHCDGRFEDRWSEGRWHNRWDRSDRDGRFDRDDVRGVATPPPAPQTIVMPQAAPPAAPAPQIFVIMPGAQQLPAPQVVTVPVQVPAPAPQPAP